MRGRNSRERARRPATILRWAYRALRACLFDALRDGLIVANPCQLPGAGSSSTAELRPATVGEVVTIAAAMPERNAAVFHIVAWTALRSGELFGLAREHVDLDAGTIRVTRAMKILKGQPPHLGPTKTDASRRTVHMPPHRPHAAAPSTCRRTVHMPPHVTVILREHMARFTDDDPTALASPARTAVSSHVGSGAPHSLKPDAPPSSTTSGGTTCATPGRRSQHRPGVDPRHPAPPRPLDHPGRDRLSAHRS